MVTATKTAISPNMKRFNNMDSMLRAIGSESNKLIREVKAREAMTSAMSKPSANLTEVPWRDFEVRAIEAVGFDSMGWKGEVERQLSLREGTLKIFNQRGKVPYGYMVLCDMIKATTPEKADRLGWGDDEKAALHEFHAAGKTVAQIRKAMNERFGDRRDYLADGPVLGALKREGLTAKR
jgi:hypothetical protein